MCLYAGVWVKRPEGGRGRGFNEFLLIGYVLQIRCTVAAIAQLQQPHLNNRISHTERMRNIDSRGKQMRPAHEAQLSVSGTTTNLPQVTPICSHIAVKAKERKGPRPSSQGLCQRTQDKRPIALRQNPTSCTRALISYRKKSQWIETDRERGEIERERYL